MHFSAASEAGLQDYAYRIVHAFGSGKMIVEDRSDRNVALERSIVRLRPLTRRELREVDDYAVTVLGIPSMVLMENAGRGAAKVLAWAMNSTQSGAFRTRVPKVLVVCGTGNNGGDGAVLARHLESTSAVEVKVVWIAPHGSLKGDAPAQYRILEASGIEQSCIDDPKVLEAYSQDADWLVDGLFGTGLSRPLIAGEMAAEFIRVMNDSGKPLFSLDLPSGFDSDKGLFAGVVVRATLTATFVAPKPGFYVPGAEVLTGRVEIVDIGLPRDYLKRFESQTD